MSKDLNQEMFQMFEHRQADGSRDFSGQDVMVAE
jgi:hypothetical protein